MLQVVKEVRLVLGQVLLRLVRSRLQFYVGTRSESFISHHIVISGLQ